MVILLAIGAGCGAMLRYSLTNLGKRLWPQLPLATFLINLSGAFIAGALSMTLFSASVTTILLTGVCGGYTTFSTYMADTTSLWRNGRHVAACLYYVGTAVCGVLAVMFGALVGRNL